MNETKFKQCRNILTNLLKDAKRMYYQKCFEANKSSAKNTWKLLNEVANRSKSTCGEPPLTFLDSDGKACTQRGIAEGFNNFFSTVGLQLEEKIPSPDSDPLEFLANRTTDKYGVTLMTNASEIEKIIKSLNPVGGGIDGISSELLRLTYQRIIHHLTFFYNLCLQEAVFPRHLKTAIIKPIHKTGDKNVFNNYRPISMLPVFSKILEKILHSRISDYINEHNLLHPLQFGFRKKA